MRELNINEIMVISGGNKPLSIAVGGIVGYMMGGSIASWVSPIATLSAAAAGGYLGATKAAAAFSVSPIIGGVVGAVVAGCVAAAVVGYAGRLAGAVGGAAIAFAMVS